MADPLAHIWAKSADKGKPAGESLKAHTANVLARLAAFRERYPALHTHTDRADLWDLAAWACALHDAGKVAAGFQAMIRNGPPFGHRHEVLSLVAVGWLDVPEPVRALVAAGVATHHRDIDNIFRCYPDPICRDIADLLSQLSPSDEAALRQWLSGAGPDPARHGFAPLPPLRLLSKDDAMAESMAALDDLRARIGAPGADATVPSSLTARALRGLVVLADHAASAHERLGRAPSLDTPAALLSVLNESFAGNDLHPHQLAAAETDGHALLIAPTGSGKTESALLWAARQRERAPGAPPIFYVLPYRASLNAMHARIPARYGVAERAVVLQHASATAALFGHLLENKGYTLAAAAHGARHAQNLARLMTAPIRVLTPYQLLRGFFGLRGHEAVLTDAAGGLFLYDELHAYDIPRLALILAGLQHLTRDLGARVFAMSATFPAVLKHLLADLLGAPPIEIIATPETRAAFRRHRLHLVPGDLCADAALDAICARYQDGQAVLVVATTVARAQRLFAALRGRLGPDPVTLLHSRFTARDRGAKERALAERAGTGRRAPGGPGTVLVATQVVEVSLDIDFDVLFTDPAPIEALVQRFGRINRGRRGDLFDVLVHCAIPDGDPVYDRDDLDRALAILTPHAGLPIDEDDIQTWVDAAYAPRAAAFRAQVLRLVAENRAAVIAANHPLTTHDDLKDRFDALFDGREVVPASFRPEHERLLADSPLEAAFLRVPISEAQHRRLRRRKRLQGEYALVPYDPTLGLNLDGS